ncbi:hypothetical protein [Luteimonas sp. MC1750]|uniref:hypothetical protein n=1 Tax=Luteimonas sp. MC1750 TaxID=2799326 RepID=UPI0018F06D68|nr:hypothetical protein [Luteimonas sp. MC1750]MBJ6984019.1 hypothetical protein [Luteimonas sp. MC1750]QQO06831.1 hypothetical protein JGR68_05235 [Luteimonas sp. MC1750]
MRLLAISLFLLLSTPALAQNYGHVQVRGAQELVLARVIQISPVRIDNRTNSYAGANIGSQVGYSLGNSMGNGNYGVNQITAQIGREIGQAMEERRHNRGVEIIVRDANGRAFAIVQEGNVAVAPGDLVALVGHGNQTRVVRLADR